MPEKNRGRKGRIGRKTPAGIKPVVAIEVRGERFEVAPAPGYMATVILLAEYRAWLDSMQDPTARARVTYSLG